MKNGSSSGAHRRAEPYCKCRRTFKMLFFDKRNFELSAVDVVNVACTRLRLTSACDRMVFKDCTRKRIG